MTKARDLANLIAAGNPLADGAITVAEISGLTASAAELNKLDGVTASTTEINKLDGLTSSTADLNNVAGINSSVQTQLNAKAPLASPTFTGTVTIGGTTYPTSDGSSGQFLKTDGSGSLSFATVSTSVSINDITDATTVGSGVGLGSLANNSITSGTKNIAIGESSSRELTTASQTVSVGHASGLLTTTGSYNVNIGAYANYSNFTGTSNVAVGRRSLYGSYGHSHSRNTAIGYQSGFEITTGADNFFGGYLAAKTLTTGNYNVAIGSNALYYPSTGNNNVAIGREALHGQSGANPYNNVAIGESAARNLSSTNNSNTIVGHQAGSTVESSSNTLIGASAGGNIITGSNNIAIGYNAQASSSSISNEITLGGSSHNRLRIPGITSGASDGDALVWNATYGSFETGAAGGGAYELLSTTNVSSATYNVFLDWGSSYSGHFKVIIENMTVNTTNSYLNLRFRTGSSSPTSNYYSMGKSYYPNNTSSFARYNENHMQLTTVDTAADGDATLNGEIDIFAAGISNKNTFGQSRIVQMPGSPGSYNYVAGSNVWFTRNNSSATVTGLNLFHFSAQINGGTFKLYKLS